MPLGEVRLKKYQSDHEDDLIGFFFQWMEMYNY